MNRSAGSTGPRTRQRLYKAPPTLDVPDIEQDAAERKRVLNVLAQRRYRQKKRQERLKSTQTQNEDPTSSNAVGELIEASPEDVLLPDQPGVPPVSTSEPQPPHSGIVEGVGVALADLELLPWDSLDDPSLSSFLSSSSSSSEALTGQALCDGGNGLVQPNLACQSTGLSPPELSTTLDSPSSSALLSTSSESDFDFIDNYLLPVHELTLLKAFGRIARRLGCESTDMWRLDCLSPFNSGAATPSEQLPVAWRPTVSQVTIPHHPLLDFMPWPGVRDRVLMMFSLPESARPPHAQGPLGLINFAYDFEDNSEGVRIYGSDPCDPDSWEVGQVFFERWWFLFDRKIIETSNRWRELRGAPQLAMKASE